MWGIVTRPRPSASIGTGGASPLRRLSRSPGDRHGLIRLFQRGQLTAASEHILFWIEHRVELAPENAVLRILERADSRIQP